MTSEAATIGLTHSGSEDTGLGDRGPQSKSIVVPYGFWLFVLSDMVLFSALFATYASLVHATDGGPTTNQLFDRNLVAIETMALLLSSFVCGLAMITAKRANMLWTQVWLVLTGVLGLVFLGIELHEFASMIAEASQHEELKPGDTFAADPFASPRGVSDGRALWPGRRVPAVLGQGDRAGPELRGPGGHRNPERAAL